MGSIPTGGSTLGRSAWLRIAHGCSPAVVTTLTSGYGLRMAQRAYEISAQLLTRRLVIDLGYVTASRCPRP